MSELESRIKDLEHKLALKKAYLGVQFKFSKGVSSEIREEVVAKLTSASRQMADNQEKISLTDESITTEDLKILKLLANSVRSKQNASTASAVKPTPNTAIAVEKSLNDPEGMTEQNEMVGRMATILSLDGIPDKKTRGKVEPRTTVRVKQVNEHLAYVQDLKGNHFNISLEDLELKPRRKEK